MDRFKLTSWNIKWADTLLDDLEGTDVQKKQTAERRLPAIANLIAAMRADILLIIEGLEGEERARRFFGLAAPDYTLVVRDDADGESYRTSGKQWVWFLIRKSTPIAAALLNLEQWDEHTSQASFGSYARTWRVATPKFIQQSGTLKFEPEVSHTHYRHPQVLQAEIDGFRFEIIGAHLKSKHINMSTPAGVGTPGFFKNNPAFVSEVVKARAKLTSEATSVRYYIDERFKADVEVPIIVAGDLNDGPGKELVEEQFLLHDLISNLQGEVFFARRFLNHALFDFVEEERWTVQFEDKLDPRRPREILLDHILFTQSFVGPNRPGAADFRAIAHGGLVEHELHHVANAQLPLKAQTSDHRPVSMTFEKRVNA